MSCHPSSAVAFTLHYLPNTRYLLELNGQSVVQCHPPRMVLPEHLRRSSSRYLLLIDPWLQRSLALVLRQSRLTHKKPPYCTYQTYRNSETRKRDERVVISTIRPPTKPYPSNVWPLSPPIPSPTLPCFLLNKHPSFNHTAILCTTFTGI